MPILLWDASALAKRYAPEVGSSTVDALFAAAPAPQMVTTVLGYAETYSVLLRKHHRGSIQLHAFSVAKASLRDEIINSPTFVLLTVDDAAIFAGIALMEQHNVNATDAAVLALFLRYRHALPPGAPGCALVAADQRLLLAAHAEGLTTLNPEIVIPADVPALLAGL